MFELSSRLFEEAVTEIYRKSHYEIKHSRELSWDYCYSLFYEAINDDSNGNVDYDYLGLNLAFYLASWGMYRGSSFLLQTDYKVHVKAVQLIVNHDLVKELLGIECVKLCDERYLDAIESLRNQLKEYYSNIRRQIKGEITTPISDVLVTKILLGTLACVPAYDEYFSSAVSSYGVASGVYNIESLRQLVDFYRKNSACFERVRINMKVISKDEMEYPQMKFLDMGFWLLGTRI